jgi:hypothetical protein
MTSFKTRCRACLRVCCFAGKSISEYCLRDKPAERSAHYGPGDYRKMNYLTKEKPQRLESDNLILEQMPDELMIFDPDRNKAFCLNQTAAFVWRHCDGKTTVSEMTERLGEDWGKPVDEQVIWFALDLLRKDGLLAPSRALVAASGVTRRAVLQKLGTGAAMAVPLVTVLFVNPAKAHASSLAPNTPPNTESLPSRSNGGFWAWLEKIF